MHKPDGHVFDLCASHLALSFANTVSQRQSEAPIERLPSYRDLLSFARQTELIDEADEARLRKLDRSDPARTERVRRQAIELREAIYSVAFHVASGEPVPEAARETLGRYAHKLVIGPDLGWTWAEGDRAPDAMLGPIVRAALDLLTTSDRERIKICEADDCVWVFYDGSKNRSRRWCDMAQCGNRAKARRFYAAKRRGAATDADDPP